MNAGKDSPARPADRFTGAAEEWKTKVTRTEYFRARQQTSVCFLDAFTTRHA
jgi:hypothetical protein